MKNKIYKIVEFIEATGQIIIKVDGYHSLIAIDLPIDEKNSYPIGDELNFYINGFVPFAYLERIEKLKNPILNAQLIKDMVEPLN